MTTAVMWFRNDLRLADNPALVHALRSAESVVPLFVVDDVVSSGRSGEPDAMGAARAAFVVDSLRSLDDRIGGALVVRRGEAADVVVAVVREVEATQVFCADDFTPGGQQRDEAVEAALRKDDVVLERVGSAYAVDPGNVTKGDGTPYKVFTPFSRAWHAHGWATPSSAPRQPSWARVEGRDLPSSPEVTAELPPPGEAAAHRRLERFLERGVGEYARRRDVPAVEGTSRLSPYLAAGCIHPRQVLAKLDRTESARTFANEICWREFAAHVLFHFPRSAGWTMNPAMADLRYDEGREANARFDAWREGRTGYPIVDAGMRQLLGEAWIHNRVRMVVASFLTKDLHIDWRRGAAHFMEHLVDGDVASNSLNWQWVAGTGTDAAPYFRIFNPVAQGKKFDPDGEYVARWVPELRDVPPKFRQEPWTATDGMPEGYPTPVVDHDVERKEALDRYQAIR
jgi:deoxyribodipyrimidine photo-lyase